VNTLSARPTYAPQEQLTSYDALCLWTVEQGVLDAATAATITAKGRRRPPDAELVLRRTRELRELAHAAIRELAANRGPAPAMLDALAERLAPWYSRGQLVRDGQTLQWADATDDTIDAPLWCLTRIVARAVGSATIAHARACAADDCGWWFLDETKNHSRRWCDMKLCGNRAKVRRFRAREVS
jgi:predicted RNA-binding Zn ribbon-like protein